MLQTKKELYKEFRKMSRAVFVDSFPEDFVRGSFFLGSVGIIIIYYASPLSTIYPLAGEYVMLLAMGLTVVLIGAYALVVPRVKYSKCRLNEKKLLRVLEQYQNLLCEERKQLKVARKNEHKKLETLQDQLENNLKILGTDHLYLYEKTQKKLAEVKNKISTLNREDQEEQERLKAELEHSQKVFQEMIAEMEEKQRKKAEKLEQKSREKAEKPFQNATPQSIFLESLFRDRD